MRRIGAAIFFLTGMFGCAEKIEHDLELAAKRAVEFAEVTFVRRNLDKGYALLATKARSYVPIEKFNETVSEMHRSGYPVRVTVVGAASPIPGEKVVNVVLRGEDGGKQFHYRVTVAGTATTDYHVTTFGGGATPLLPLG